MNSSWNDANKDDADSRKVTNDSDSDSGLSTSQIKETTSIRDAIDRVQERIAEINKKIKKEEDRLVRMDHAKREGLVYLEGDEKPQNVTFLKQELSLNMELLIERERRLNTTWDNIKLRSSLQTYSKRLRSVIDQIDQMRQENDLLRHDFHSFQQYSKEIVRTIQQQLCTTFIEKQELLHELKGLFHSKLPAQKGLSPYDVTLEASAVSQLATPGGWPIKASKSILPPLMDSVVVSVMGVHQSGKSHVLSTLSGSARADLFSSFPLQEGIGVILPRSTTNPVTYLEMTGLDAPIAISKGDDNQREQSFQDRTICDHLLQGFMLSESDLVLVTVNHMTFADQIFMERILKTIRLRKLRKKVCIIHNFPALTEVDEVLEAINKEILTIPDCECVTSPRRSDEETQFGKYFVQKDMFLQSEIVHFVLAREGSRAGDHFNNAARKALHKIVSDIPLRRQFDFPVRLQKFLEGTLIYFINFCKPLDRIDILKQNVQGVDTATLQILSQERNYRMTFRALNFDVIETLVYSDFHPNYDCRRVRDEIIWTIELPGMSQREINDNVRAKCYKEENGYVLRIEGRKLEEDSHDVHETVESSRRFGEFKFATAPLPFSKYQFAELNPKGYDQNGLLMFKWKLLDENQSKPGNFSFF